MRSHSIHDAFGRPLHYLRLSVTDRCNFKCVYCLPGGCPKPEGDSRPLDAAEIGRLTRAFAGLGFWKVRLTGGEPTLRQDIVEIVRAVASTPGIQRVGITTNGYRLAELAAPLKAAGLVALNVSLDSLDPTRFERLSGTSHLSRVIEGVEAALACGIESVKLNVVLLKDMPEAEFERFVDWARRAPLSVRFIELMKTQGNEAFFESFRASAQTIRERLVERGWAAQPHERQDGPAAYHKHPEAAGRVGLIAPYGDRFCGSCNRLRVNALGALRLCLFHAKEVSLRPLLDSDAKQQELMRLIEDAVKEKPLEHQLSEKYSLAAKNLASTGG